MVQIDRINGQNYADNIIDPLLAFDGGTWTVASGTGTATLDANNPFFGVSSLKIENNTPLSNIIVSNSAQATTISYDDSYILSFFVKKDAADKVRDGAVLIYKNAVLLTTETFTIGSADGGDLNDTWVRYQTEQIALLKSDVITLQFRLDAIAELDPTTTIWIDGVMLNATGRNNFIVPQFVPNNQIKVPTLPTADGNYQLTITSGVASWTEII